MENRNICKFNYSRASDLICTNFVFETEAVQSEGQSLNYHLIGLVESGKGVLHLGEQDYSLKPGVLFFIPKLQYFSIQSEERLQYFYISYHGRRGEEYMVRLGICIDRCVFSGYDSLIPFWKSSQHLAEEGNIDMVCEAVLLYSLANLRPNKADDHDLLTRTTALMQEKFTDSELSVITIAAELGYDAKYLSSFFKKRKGITLTRYLRELRIRHAVFLMEDGLTIVKNIALLSGFRDPLYFSRIFTQEEGISPREYIDRCQDKQQGAS